MFDTGSVFDVLASDDSGHRLAQRKALALSQARLDNTLGRFLQGAVTADEFQARMAAVQEDFTRHVAEASAEVGYDQPERLLPVLTSHYERSRRWQPVHSFGTPQVHYDGPAYPDAGAQQTYGQEGVCPECGATTFDGNCSNGQCSASQPYGYPEAMPQAGGYPPARYEGQDSNYARTAQDIGEEVDTAEMQDSNDGKGVNEPHQDDEDEDAPEIKFSGVRTADGNTDLDGPEPKMDKRLWEPSNLGDPDIADGRWPTERKDVVDPIGPPNNEHPLKEIGEKFTETQSLPSETENSGFQSGGPGPAPHTDTFGNDGQATPVTHETQPE